MGPKKCVDLPFGPNSLQDPIFYLRCIPLMDPFATVLSIIYECLLLNLAITSIHPPPPILPGFNCKKVPDLPKNHKSTSTMTTFLPSCLPWLSNTTGFCYKFMKAYNI